VGTCTVYDNLFCAQQLMLLSIFLFQISQLRTEMEEMDMKITERNVAHNEELVLRDGLISKQEADIRTLEDKLTRLQQQVLIAMARSWYIKYCCIFTSLW
jgi:hypothetical protein